MSAFMILPPADGALSMLKKVPKTFEDGYITVQSGIENMREPNAATFLEWCKKKMLRDEGKHNLRVITRTISTYPGLVQGACDKDGNNALHIACQLYHTTLLALLWEMDKSILEALLVQENNEYLTPFGLACRRNREETTAFLAQQIMTARRQREANAGLLGEVDVVPLYLFDAAGLKETFLVRRNEQGETLMHVACKHNASKAIRQFLLLSNGTCNLYEQLDRDGSTPLDIACMKDGRKDAVREILSCSSNKEALLRKQGEHHYTPLHIACAHNAYAVVLLLLSSVDNPVGFVEEVSGYELVPAPFHLACTYQADATIDYFIQQGLVTATTCYYATEYSAVHVACETNNSTLVERLVVEVHIDPWDVSNVRGDTALHTACGHNTNAVVTYLLTLPGALGYIQKENKTGFTPLTLACVYNAVDVLEVLWEKARTSLNADDTCMLMLRHACRGDALEVVQKLQAYFPTQDFGSLQDAEGNTPLHWCCDAPISPEHNQGRVLGFLLHTYYLDFRQKNKMGKIPLDLAERGGPPVAIKIFEALLIEEGRKVYNGAYPLQETIHGDSEHGTPSLEGISVGSEDICKIGDKPSSNSRRSATYSLTDGGDRVVDASASEFIFSRVATARLSDRHISATDRPSLNEEDIAQLQEGQHASISGSMLGDFMEAIDQLKFPKGNYSSSSMLVGSSSLRFGLDLGTLDGDQGMEVYADEEGKEDDGHASPDHATRTPSPEASSSPVSSQQQEGAPQTRKGILLTTEGGKKRQSSLPHQVTFARDTVFLRGQSGTLLATEASSDVLAESSTQRARISASRASSTKERVTLFNMKLLSQDATSITVDPSLYPWIGLGAVAIIGVGLAMRRGVTKAKGRQGQRGTQQVDPEVPTEETTKDLTNEDIEDTTEESTAPAP